MKKLNYLIAFSLLVVLSILIHNCTGTGETANIEEAAKKLYVKPGSYDELYAFVEPAVAPARLLWIDFSYDPGLS